jgi:small redox-active disulfide protein 2
MKIQVLGSGCPTCKKLFEMTKKAVSELNVEAEVEYVTDIQKIIEMGVMQSPVLAIDGKPVSTGYIDNIEQIKKVISDNDNFADSDCGCSWNSGQAKN